MRNLRRSILLTRILNALFGAAVIYAIVRLPMIMRWYTFYTGKYYADVLPLQYTLWGISPAALFALFSLEGLLGSIGRGEVFSQSNVSRIGRLSLCCFVVGTVFILFFFVNILGIILALVAVFMGLILLVLRNVFRQAVELKDENDLTV